MNQPLPVELCVTLTITDDIAQALINAGWTPPPSAIDAPYIDGGTIEVRAAYQARVSIRELSEADRRQQP